MKELIESHALLLAAGFFYMFVAAANSLPDGKFEFYPWFTHTMKQLANVVPQKYQPKP